MKGKGSFTKQSRDPRVITLWPYISKADALSTQELSRNPHPGVGIFLSRGDANDGDMGTGAVGYCRAGAGVLFLAGSQGESREQPSGGATGLAGRVFSGRRGWGGWGAGWCV